MTKLPPELLQKISRYCAYQERCGSEVRKKLYALGADAQQTEAAIEWLQSENFVNESRFAHSFARGKFLTKRWGRLRIRHELRRKNVPDTLIEEALVEEIDDDRYRESLGHLLEKKLGTMQALSPAKKKQGLIRYLNQKGYEYDYIHPMLKEHFSE